MQLHKFLAAHWADATKGFPLGLYIPKWYWETWGSPSLAGLKGFLVSSNYPVSARLPFKTLYDRDGGDSGIGWHAYGGKTPALWQFASSDAIPGIVGNCDCNAYKGSYDSFVTLATGKVITPPKPPAPAPAPTPTHPVFVRTLKVEAPMMHGNDVKEWQAQMHKRKWTIDVDGYYGPKSAAVAKAFQVEKKLVVAHLGQVDKLTWNSSWTLPIT